MLRLNRTVMADGVEYPPGTALAALPQCNQESVLLNGWAQELDQTDQSAETDQDQSDQTDRADQDQSDQTDQTDQADQDQTDPAPVQDMPAPVSVTDLATFPDLNPDHLELLQSQGIHTLEQAQDYLAANKSFRPLKGIGRAGDEQIRSALGL